MPESGTPSEGQPLTLQQKLTLIAAYERTGNMSRAMREADIRSPRTAYLWWRRYSESGVDGLEPRSHARHTQERLPDELVVEICDLRRAHSDWGRRRIADELARLHSSVVVSPAGVEAALRRSNLWLASNHLPARPDWLTPRGAIDRLRLLEIARSGIQLSLASEADAAVGVLQGQLWVYVGTDPALWPRLLNSTDYELGGWLLCSRLHLGHSLMNSGRRPEAVRCLEETITWMREHPVEPHERTKDPASDIVSLRRDDIWLECYQHYALLLAKTRASGGLGYLVAAHAAAQRRHATQLMGIERDLAQLKLKLARPPVAEIRSHLTRSKQLAENADSLASLAFTYFAWARMYDHMAQQVGDREQATRRRQRNLMQQAIERGLRVMELEQADRPMRLTLCYVDAAQLTQAHGLPMDSHWIQRAAEYCLAYRYRDQARQLAAIPGLDEALPAGSLRELWRLAEST